MPTYNYRSANYAEPGVTVIEDLSPNVVPLLSTADAICIVGPASNKITVTETVKFTGTDVIKLQLVPSDATMDSSSITSVKAVDTAVAQNGTDNPKTTLTADYAVGATSIVVKDASPFASAGTVYIDSEKVTYSKTSNTLTTSALVNAHTNGAPVNTYDPTSGYPSTAYTFVPGTADGAGTNAHTIARVNQTTSQGTPEIPAESYAYVTYTYTPKDFWTPQKFDNMSDVESKFGTKYNTSKTAINSPLSFAAQLAFENGASNVIIQPLFYSADSGVTKAEPTSSQVGDVNTTWNPTLTSLRDQEGIGIIVPVIGQTSAVTYCTADTNQANGVYSTGTITQTGTSVTGSGTAFTTAMGGKTLVYADGTTDVIATSPAITGTSFSVSGTKTISTGQSYKILTSEINDATVVSIFQAFQDHVDYQQKYNDQYMVVICGEDGTDTTILSYAARTTIQSHAVALQSRYVDETAISRYAEDVVLLGASKFKRPLPSGNNKLALGGQYAAAGVAGMLASRKISSTLTRKNLVGFSDLVENLSRQNKTEDSSRGLFVIEQNGYVLQVRHALTLNTISVDKSELSVVRAKQKVINSLRLTVDEQVIGRVVADNNAPLIVASAIGGSLSTMVDDGDIVAFSDVQAKILSYSPTTIEVRFSYRPAFPVNYINIRFSIDLTSGSLTLGETANKITSGVANG